jgi:hypothetical protein
MLGDLATYGCRISGRRGQFEVTTPFRQNGGCLEGTRRQSEVRNLPSDPIRAFLVEPIVFS